MQNSLQIQYYVTTLSTQSNWINFLISGDLYIPNGCACFSIHTDTPVWLRAVFCRNLVEFLYTNTIYYNTLSTLPNWISCQLFISHHQANTTHRIREPCLNHGNQIHIVMSLFVMLAKTSIMISLVAILSTTKFNIYFMQFLRLPIVNCYLLEIFHFYLRINNHYIN